LKHKLRLLVIFVGAGVCGAAATSLANSYQKAGAFMMFAIVGGVIAGELTGSKTERTDALKMIVLWLAAFAAMLLVSFALIAAMRWVGIDR